MNEQTGQSESPPLGVDTFAILGQLVLCDALPAAELQACLAWDEARVQPVLDELTDRDCIVELADGRLQCTAVGREVYFAQIAWLAGAISGRQ